MEPKKQALADATNTLEGEKSKLQAVQDELASVIANVEELQATTTLSLTTSPPASLHHHQSPSPLDSTPSPPSLPRHHLTTTPAPSPRLTPASPPLPPCPSLLQAACDRTVAEKQRLQEAADTTDKRLKRAGKLTSGLADEAVRWAETVAGLKVDYGNLVGDVFIAAAFVAYNGPFTMGYRKAIVEHWIESMNENKVGSTSTST